MSDEDGAIAARRIGELERLGEGGRDWLVLGVEAEGFDELPVRSKLLAYHLYRAAIAGNDILYLQNHRHALEIKNLLEAILSRAEEIDEDLRDAVHEYLKYVWINHGQYDAVSGAKVVPRRLGFEGLVRAAEQAARAGARFETRRGESLAAKLERLRASIFEADVEPLLTDQREGRDIVAASAVNLWDPGITAADLEALPAALRSALNVRFARAEDGSIVAQRYRIGGLFDPYLRAVVHFLHLALPYAETEDQRRGLEELVRFFRTGDEEHFRRYSIHWLRSDTVVDYLNGFIEQYRDPRGAIGSYEANVSFVADSLLVGRLADSAAYFEQRMPWPERFRRARVRRPVANVVKLLVATGDAGPYAPVAYNLPNDARIREELGSKNVILLNIEMARSEEIREAILGEFYLPEYRELVRRWGDLGGRWETYMHEVIGHGSGRPDPDAPRDPRLALGRVYAALEECRADLVGLYHLFDPRLVEIGAFRAEDQRDIALATYVQFLQGHVAGYRRLEEDELHEAHVRGRELVLQYLVRGGEEGREDYGVRIVERGGDVFVRVEDLDAARRGVAALLGRLQIAKSTCDVAAAERLFDRLAARVPSAWRRNVRERAARLGLPAKTAFVFPRLVPVRDGAGALVDVRLAYDEDLTAQQLRWSRLAASIDDEPSAPA